MLLKVDDEVLVIAGGDKGHRGKVLVVDRKKNKVVVEGAGLGPQARRRSQKNPQGGRLSKEMPIHASNVMVIDPSRAANPTASAFAIWMTVPKNDSPRRAAPAWAAIAPPRDSYKK